MIDCRKHDLVIVCNAEDVLLKKVARLRTSGRCIAICTHKMRTIEQNYLFAAGWRLLYPEMQGEFKSHELTDDNRQLLVTMKEVLLREQRIKQAESHEQKLVDGTSKNFLLLALQRHCVFQSDMISSTRVLSKFYLEMHGGMNIYYNDAYLKRNPMQATMLLFSIGKQLKVHKEIPNHVAGVELRHDALGQY